MKEIAEIIARGRHVQAKWAALPYKERRRRLKKAARFLGSHINEVTELIHKDSGKARLDTLRLKSCPL